MRVLTVNNLVKTYGSRRVVDGVSLAIEKGQCFGLLGPNGAGKTTTLRLLLGLIQPDSGTIEILGHAVPQQAREARLRVGVVPQMDNLDPDFTVRENLLVYGRYFGLSKAEIEARIPRLLELAGLQARADSPINTLSGGMKRRLTLARALVNDPDLIFLDEPTTGLDPQARHLLWQSLRRLMNEGKTILLTTHYMDEAERLCDVLGIMDGGKLIASGPPRELIAQHIEPSVVEVYGDALLTAQPLMQPHCDRLEWVGETLFGYCSQAETVLASLKAQHSLRVTHRPANLEDVFLKLTGRELRD